MKRLIPRIGSKPIVESRIPASPRISPFNTSPPDTATIILRPKPASIKYSAELNVTVNLAIGVARRISANVLIIPPINEKITLIPSANPPFPCLYKAYPSNDCVIDAGVPGVLIKIAVIPPAKIAAFQSPISIAKPSVGSNQKVIGVMIAIPIVADNPGKAPIIVPIRTPKNRNIITEGFISSAKPAAHISNPIPILVSPPRYALNKIENPMLNTR